MRRHTSRPTSSDPVPSRPLLGWMRAPSATRGMHVPCDDGWELRSWARIAAQARAVAATLGESGVRAGDVVGIAARGPSFAAGLFGTLWHGATAVPLPVLLPFQERTAQSVATGEAVALTGPRVILRGPGAGGALDGLAAGGGPPVLDVPEADDAPAAAASAAGRPRPDDVALLQLSSGTTGRRHAVAISTAALQANVDAIAAWLEIGDEDATASWLPCHHDMGLVGCLLTPAACGSDLWLSSPDAFLRDPLHYLQRFSGPSAATMSAMPAFGLDYLAGRVAPGAVAALDLSRWRALIVGAERIAPATLTRFAELLEPAGFDARALLPAYGLAEATLAVTGHALRRSWRAAPIPGGAGRAVSCGRPLGDTAVAVVDERGRELPPGEVGELVVTGPSVAAALAEPRSGEAPTRLAGDRLMTGDAGFVAGGEVVVLGRLDDGVKVRGRFVAAQDVEHALVAAALPARRLAVAVGAATGGALTTLVVLEGADEDAADRAHRAARTVAEGTEVMVILAPPGTIERTANGKLRRSRLWRLLAQAPPGAAHDPQPVAEIP